jgi:hypothetical protein
LIVLRPVVRSSQFCKRCISRTARFRLGEERLRFCPLGLGLGLTRFERGVQVGGARLNLRDGRRQELAQRIVRDAVAARVLLCQHTPLLEGRPVVDGLRLPCPHRRLHRLLVRCVFGAEAHDCGAGCVKGFLPDA